MSTEEFITKILKSDLASKENRKQMKKFILIFISYVMLCATIYTTGVIAGLEIALIIKELSSLPKEACMILGAFIVSIIFNIFFFLLKVVNIDLPVNNGVMKSIFLWMFILNLFLCKI